MQAIIRADGSVINLPEPEDQYTDDHEEEREQMTWTLSKAHMDADHREAQRGERIWRELTRLDDGESTTIYGVPAERAAGELYFVGIRRELMNRYEARLLLQDVARDVEELTAVRHLEDATAQRYDQDTGMTLAWFRSEHIVRIFNHRMPAGVPQLRAMYPLSVYPASEHDASATLAVLIRDESKRYGFQLWDVDGA